MLAGLLNCHVAIKAATRRNWASQQGMMPPDYTASSGALVAGHVDELSFYGNGCNVSRYTLSGRCHHIRRLLLLLSTRLLYRPKLLRPSLSFSRFIVVDTRTFHASPRTCV